MPHQVVDSKADGSCSNMTAKAASGRSIKAIPWPTTHFVLQVWFSFHHLNDMTQTNKPKIKHNHYY